MSRGSAVAGGPGWEAGRVLVPGTEEQLGALGLFAPPGEGMDLDAPGGVLHARAADAELLWLGFGEVCRAGTAGVSWAELAPWHAVWVVDGVPVLRTAASADAAAFLALAEALHAADVPLVLLAAKDPGPLPRPLPLHETADGGLPRLRWGS
ncbi:hypothetical protein SAT01_03340 [Sinomonas atrocyanea]|uniref:AFG1/ZapE family ATPase n=1 Tax=Sinomonas atrocyanea TaxID=37927 RepID=UPI000836A7A3|nr:AFG1/ZapE family ATPase [Sinomonas atrocyanea]GEB62886.1 hypothetical protein SAT01_03340 [Sinomonas atrocyanea]GGG81243.1 hypothetical protein GCM10007172_38320 [Sinomonas atrocyanea]